MVALNRSIADVGHAMSEQVTATTQISQSVEGIRKQSGQVSQAMLEQARATKEAAQAAENVARQIRLITAANNQHAAAAEGILKSIAEVRAITDRNAQSVEDARTLAETLRQNGTNRSARAGQTVRQVAKPAARGNRSSRK
jgi:methyl-accepting chemotaxis protein